MDNRHLFRGKRLDSGEWVVGYYAEIGLHRLILTGQIIPDKNNYLDWERYEIDPTTIGQCTGLEDKNGNLIFEGDVLSVCVNERYHPESGKKCIVKFGEYKHTDAQSYYPNGDLGFFIEWHSGKFLRNDILFWVKNECVEIIGNIHDEGSDEG